MGNERKSDMIRLRYNCRWHHIGDHFFGVTFCEDGRLLPGVITLNEVGYSIVLRLAESTTREAIVNSLMAEYEATREEVEASVDDVLRYLEEEQMLTRE